MLTLLQGDALEQLQSLESKSVQCCVTSPPYWGLRDYGATSQLGLEPTPEAYVVNMVAMFREVGRVLRDDGTLWLNLGDSYAGSGTYQNSRPGNPINNSRASNRNGCGSVPGLKPKDLCGIPWRLAFALQADGWYLRSDIIWHKPNPMPESVTDRPTKSHEYIFLLTKSSRYFWDAEAIREPLSEVSLQQIEYFKKNGARNEQSDKVFDVSRRDSGGALNTKGCGSRGSAMDLAGRNKRSVWTIPTQPYADAHFATFPEELPKLCILAGSKLDDTVLDPFAGSGTTGKVAIELGRRAILIELNPDYCEMIRTRCTTTIGML